VGNAPVMSGARELKVYRAPFACMVPGWVGAGLLFLIGVGGVTFGARQSYAALNVVTGVLALLFSLMLGAVLATNRLIVTPAGLVYCNNLRRRVLSWTGVRSFGVGASRTMMRWPTLVIRRDDDSALVTHLASFTRKYPAQIADELAAWQRQLAPAALGQLP
jgi:hypothetical protein